MAIAGQDRRQAYAHWLRTGFWPIVRTPDGIELKFNPYHDPRNGQFTFAPGGSRSLSNVVVSRGRQRLARGFDPAGRPSAPDESRGSAIALSNTRRTLVTDAVYRPDDSAAQPQQASFPRIPRATRGSNSGRFQDPMTLEQTFPGLQDSPAGTIIALADNIFDFTGPARETTAALTRNWSNAIINQIRAIDPSYRFDSLGFPETLQGQINQLNDLRFDRAAAFLRIKGELRPLQVETLRFIQASADRAYETGQELLRAGRLRIRLSEQEALGNFVDQWVRRDLRARYSRGGIDSAGSGPVRVNRRENDSSGTELTFRRPDGRVGNIAYDVTLTQKTLKTQQVRGFFDTDFRPTHVIIIRPRQASTDYTYIITRPEPTR